VFVLLLQHTSYCFFNLPSRRAQCPRSTKAPVVSLASELKAALPNCRFARYTRSETTIEQTIPRTTGPAETTMALAERTRTCDGLLTAALCCSDINGPGVVNRIWTPTPSDDSLDFYIDDTTRAAFTIQYKDLFSGKVFPFVAPLCNNQLGGYYCYLPIPFQRRCMIIFRGKQTQFYQVGYRLFPSGHCCKDIQYHPGCRRKKQPCNACKPCGTNESLPYKISSRRKARKRFKHIKAAFQLRPGTTQPLFQTSRGGRIIGIELEPASAFEGLTKDVDLKITWDGEAQPAVYCPVADFFGYAFGQTSMQSLLIGTSGRKNYCYFPMPFDRSAKS
jgi:hypothetical protein